MSLVAQQVITLFESDNILVRYMPAVSKDLLVVTFACYEHNQRKNMQGFGEGLFKKANISAIHITCANNLWWQYPEMQDIGSITAEIRAGYDTIVAYGLSMGGYGAIMFSGLLEADRVVAISPQYSIDTKKVPFETFWAPTAKNINFINDSIGTNVCGDVIVIYDNRSVDEQHTNKIADEMAITKIPIPYSGHPASRFLKEVGVISSMMLSLIKGDGDYDEYIKTCHRLRANSASYWVSLSRKGLSIKRKILCLRKAQQLNPTWADVFTLIAETLLKNKEFDAAAEEFEKAIRYSANSAWLHHRHALSLMLAGRLDDALAPAKRAIELDFSKAFYHVSLGEITQKIAIREFDAALAAFKKALELEPNNSWYWYLLSKLYEDKNMFLLSLDAANKANDLKPEENIYKVLIERVSKKISMI